MILSQDGRLHPWLECFFWSGLFIFIPPWSESLFQFRIQFLVQTIIFVGLHWRIFAGMRKPEDDPGLLGLQTGYLVGEYFAFPEFLALLAYAGGRFCCQRGLKAIWVYQGLWAQWALLLQLRQVDRWQSFRFFSLYQDFDPHFWIWIMVALSIKAPWVSALLLLKVFGPTGILPFLLWQVPQRSLWLFRLVLGSELLARWTGDPQALFLHFFCGLLSLLAQK